MEIFNSSNIPNLKEEEAIVPLFTLDTFLLPEDQMMMRVFEPRYKQMLENFNFFGAPAALFCFIDRQMNQPQWSDLGMFLQTFMLLAQEEGIDTCAQESWSLKQKLVSEFVNAEADLMLFCGMAIGYKEISAPINNYQTKRRNIDEWVTFVSKK